MDFRHIRAFIAVADALSVTKAAERLHISQPPLSRHLQQLEQELGTTLFLRHRQGVTLTDAGRLLLEKARVLEDAATAFYDTARQAARGDTGTLRVGIAWGLWDVVNKARVEFSERRPGVTIEARDAFCPEEGLEHLHNHGLDVLFARPPFDDALEVLEIYREPIQLVISDSSPLASCATVGIRDLAAEPLLLWDRHIAPVLYDRILELYAGAGMTPVMIPTPGAGPYNNAGIMQVASGKGIYLCLVYPSRARIFRAASPCCRSAIRKRPSRYAWRTARETHRQSWPSSSSASGASSRRTRSHRRWSCLIRAERRSHLPEPSWA